MKEHTICRFSPPPLLVLPSLGSAGAGGELQEAGARAGDGLLEELEGVVVVQDLDRLRQGDELLRAGLLDLLIIIIIIIIIISILIIIISINIIISSVTIIISSVIIAIYTYY